MPHIFLYGPPGTGKSTVGKILARNLKLPFIDLDRVIEKNAGMPIPKIMEAQGEPAFRDLETAALRNVVTEKESIVALGGGALLRNGNRTLVENNGRTVLLMAQLQTLLARLDPESTQRPLLAGELHEKLASLLMNRKEHYLSFPLYIHVDGVSAKENALQIQVVLGRFHLKAMGEYDAIVQKGGAGQLGDLLKERGLQDPILVTDENVGKFHSEKMIASLHKSGFDPKVITILSGESHKNLETVSELWHGFLENRLDRK